MEAVRQSLEVVEDSEPERQETWRRGREEKERSKHKAIPQFIDVIELSESEQSFTAPSQYLRTLEGIQNGTKTVISISDDCLSVDHVGEAQRPDTSLSDSSASASSSSSLSLNVRAIVAEISKNKSNKKGLQFESDSDSDEEETCTAFRNNLGHFAFSSNPGGPSTVRPPRTVPNSEKSLPAKTSRAKPSRTTFLDFSEIQLADLRKCVSCDTKWTTRKSVVQKIAHVKTCAKKGFLKDDTLKLLITREIEVAQADRIKAAKKTQTAEPEQPKSFIENVLMNVETKKTKKKAKATSSLKRITENRSTILEKATTIIGAQSANARDEDIMADIPPSTQALAPSRLASLKMPNRIMQDEGFATQPFGQSALAGRYGRAPDSKSAQSARQVSKSPELIEPPPSTQAFAPSRLSNLQSTLSLFHQDYSPSTPQIDSELLMYASPVTNFPDYAPFDDDAILIYDPDINPPRTPPPINQSIDTSKKKKGTTKRKARVLITDDDETHGKKIEDDEELAERLKDMVLSDKTLHLRILRYEPIPFETFMEMASLNGIRATGLRVKMRTFLDVQAISHYGSEPGGGRNRH